MLKNIGSAGQSSDYPVFYQKQKNEDRDTILQKLHIKHCTVNRKLFKNKKANENSNYNDFLSGNNSGSAYKQKSLYSDGKNKE